MRRASPEVGSASNDSVLGDTRSNLDAIFGEHDDALASAPPIALLRAVARVARAVGFDARRPPDIPDDALTPVDIAAASGARARPLQLPPGWWERDRGPMLAWFGAQRAPVALLPRILGGYRMYDPTQGKTCNVTPELASNIARDAVMFYATLPDRVLSLRELLLFGMPRHLQDSLLLVLAGAVGALLTMALPISVSILFSEVVPAGDRGLLVMIGLGLLLATLAVLGFECVAGLTQARIHGRSAARLNGALWDRLLRMPPHVVQSAGVGALAGGLETADALQRSLSQLAFVLVSRGQQMLMSWLALLAVSPLAAMTAGALVLVVALVVWVVNRLQRAAVSHGTALSTNVFNAPAEYLNALAKLRSAGAEERAFGRWARDFSEMRRRALKGGTVNLGFQTFSATIEVVALGITFYVIGRQGGVMDSIGLGGSLMLMSASATFVAALLALGQSGSMLSVLLARGRTLDLLLRTVPMAAQTGIAPGRLSGQVSLESVCVRYAGSDTWALQDVSIRAEAGEFVAIVGPSGAGKSTLVRTLLGLLQPAQGQVLYDGRDLESLSRDAVRRQIGSVMQNGQLIPGSLLENIAGSFDITLDDAWEAARLAGVDEDIRAMPMQMYTMVLDGASNFSGGQVQRIVLARSIASRPPILILDEATSALDGRRQAQVVERLSGLDCTRLVIAHRFSTVRKADRVYVIDGGRVTEEGGVDELIQSGGYVAQMAMREHALVQAAVTGRQPAPTAPQSASPPVHAAESVVAR